MQQFAVDAALADGAPITCATCHLFHAGNGFCGQTECGGPGAGKDFPNYNGPIPRDKLNERCLVCGKAKVQYMIVGLPTKFALCRKHRRVFQHVGEQVPGDLRHPVTLIAIS